MLLFLFSRRKYEVPVLFPNANGIRQDLSTPCKQGRVHTPASFILQAVAEATQASKTTEVEYYAGPFTGGFATLDGIFRAFYQVHVFLSDEANFGVAGVPSVDLRAESNTPWLSAVASDDAETPSQDTDECYLFVRDVVHVSGLSQFNPVDLSKVDAAGR